LLQPFSWSGEMHRGLQLRRPVWQGNECSGRRDIGFLLRSINASADLAPQSLPLRSLGPRLPLMIQHDTHRVRRERCELFLGSEPEIQRPWAVERSAERQREPGRQSCKVVTEATNIYAVINEPSY
jgi:hypothetical protein